MARDGAIETIFLNRIACHDALGVIHLQMWFGNDGWQRRQQPNTKHPGLCMGRPKGNTVLRADALGGWLFSECSRLCLLSRSQRICTRSTLVPKKCRSVAFSLTTL